MSPPPSGPSTTGPASTAPPARAATARRWRPPTPSPDGPPGRPAPHGPAAAAPWEDPRGLVALPCGVRVRGRRLADPASPADFALVLAGGPGPRWPSRRVRWPDFRVPSDPADALDALREAHRRAHAGERVEVACRGGVGRTGTALAALAVLDGLAADQAVGWVRAGYHRRAVETPWQRRWLRTVGWPGGPAG